MKKNRCFFYGLLILLFLLTLVALLAPVLAPHDPYATSLADALLGPCESYPLGTDQLGRCLLSRIVYGARLSLFSAVTVTVIVFFVYNKMKQICASQIIFCFSTVFLLVAS